MKYKVGEKVKVKKDLKIDVEYHGQYFVSEMKRYIGKTVEIAVIEITKDAEGLEYYRIKEDNGAWCWTDEMFEPKKANQEEILKEVLEQFNTSMEERNNQFNKVLETNLKAFTKEIKQRTIYDELVQDKVLEKAKDLSLKEIEEDLHKDMDRYIKNNYGILPKKIEIKKETKTKELEGIFHKKFEEILKIVDKNVPLMLTGPAGAGKNYTLEQVAKALDLDFYFTNAITQEYKLTGFIDANGKYQETQFYKAFKDGGLFFLDEVDASVPEALIILNSAIANGYFDFPNGRVDVNKDFRVVCAGNTYGTGADMVYVGRNALDGATLDRFAVIEFDYDEDVEKQLAYDNELYDFIKDLRQTIVKASLRYIVSMRATINATKLLEIGIPKKEILKSVVIKNMQLDDLNVIIKDLKDTSEWKKELEKLAKC